VHKVTNPSRHENGDFPQDLIVINRQNIQSKKISKDISELNCTINQTNLADIYIVFYPTAMEYTFYSGAHGNFSKMDNI
jgi:hypothetical protein